MVCFQEDDFTYEKPRWVAVLTDGTEVLQDDDRPGLEPSSWKRLNNYLADINSVCWDNHLGGPPELRISHIYLKFRSNIVQVPHQIYPDTDTWGYVIYRGIVSHFNEDFSFNTIVIGRMYWANGKCWLHKTTYKTPDLTVWETSAAEMTDTDWDLLILRGPEWQ